MKPLRAHHCSVCGECVYKMDHHCPWIYGCVGYYNHRYFLLFILYLLFASIYLSSLYIYVDYYQNDFADQLIITSNVYPVSKVLSIALMIMLSLFNTWNWYLAVTGITSIEFWGAKNPDRKGNSRTDRRFVKDSVRDNLAEVFGTYSFFKMLLPSIRPLFHDGKQESKHS